MQLTWKRKKFGDLSPDELYQILSLRQDVFIVEQNCIYKDMDGKDVDALHLMGTRGDKKEVLAYCRLFAPGVSFHEASIGRVLVKASARKTGTGRALMEEAIRCVVEEFHTKEIRIGAQTYLTRFYQSLGFKPEGNTYLEDGIEHVEMLLK